MSLSFLDYIITMMMQSPPEMLTLQNTFLSRSLFIHVIHFVDLIIYFIMHLFLSFV